MKHLIRNITIGLAAATPLISNAGSFEETSQHLDTDGSLVAYIDFKGDGTEISAKLNSIYKKLLEGGGDLPPIPVDFDLLFNNLGFGSIQAMGMSSKQLSDEQHVNRYAVKTNGAPSGLFSLYSKSNEEPQVFTAAAMVPADANIAGCGPVELEQLAETVRTIMVQFMGPMGEGMADQYLMMPIPGSEIAAKDLISALSGRWDYAYKMDMSDLEAPDVEFWVQISGSGELMNKIKPLGEMMPIEFTDGSDGEVIADFSALLESAETPFGLFIKSTKDGDLVIYSDSNWGGSSEGALLKDDPKFIELTKNLPQKALWYSYSGGFEILDMIDETLAMEQEMAAYVGAAMEAAEYLIGDFYEPAAAAAYYDGDYLISEQYAGYSTKQVVMLVPTMFAAYPALAFVGFQQAMGTSYSAQDVRSVSQEKAVTNNLRQIASAADQYYLENGVIEVQIDKLIGEYIRELNPVAGESYEGMIIRQGEDISVTLEDGSVISVDF